MAGKKKTQSDETTVKNTAEGLAGQVPSPNPGDAELEVGQEVKPTTVSDVVTPDGVLSAPAKHDPSIGSF